MKENEPFAFSCYFQSRDSQPLFNIPTPIPAPATRFVLFGTCSTIAIVSFRFLFTKAGKLSMCMVVGPSGRDHDPPKTNYAWFWRQMISSKAIKNPGPVWKPLSSETSSFRISKMLKIEKAWADKARSLMHSWEAWNWGQYSSRKHESEILGNLEYGINNCPKNGMGIW